MFSSQLILKLDSQIWSSIHSKRNLCTVKWTQWLSPICGYPLVLCSTSKIGSGHSRLAVAHSMYRKATFSLIPSLGSLPTKLGRTGPGAATWHVLWIKLKIELQTELQIELQIKLRTELQIKWQVCESSYGSSYEPCCELSYKLSYELNYRSVNRAVNQPYCTSDSAIYSL